MPGMTIAVAPILSLIDDQIENLYRYGISRAHFISSNVSADEGHESLDLLARGEFVFYYVTPERFQRINFREKRDNGSTEIINDRQSAKSIEICS